MAPNLDQLINSLLVNLDARSKSILKKRFGINTTSDGETLASLGKEFKITRERVRQIESQALSKMRHDIKSGSGREFFEKIKENLNHFGGVRRIHDLAKDLKASFAKSEVNSQVLHNQIRFLMEAAGSQLYAKESNHFHGVWYLDKANLEKARTFCKALKDSLDNKKSELLENGRWDKVFIQHAKNFKIAEGVGLNYISISKNFAVNPYGDFGLSLWPEIKPKTMRDKAYLILKKEKKPLHFLEITESINKVVFDNKTAHPPTVHNELIRDDRFVLVGRGIYGLKEYGFLPGTAKDAIVRLLSNNGPMEKAKLVTMVLKDRLLKPNTIFLNLQNRKYFKRLSDGKYTLA